jgi:hypothetical protein
VSLRLYQMRRNIGQCIADLELICGVFEPAEFVDHVEYLPLKWQVIHEGSVWKARRQGKTNSCGREVDSMAGRG